MNVDDDTSSANVGGGTLLFSSGLVVPFRFGRGSGRSTGRALVHVLHLCWAAARVPATHGLPFVPGRPARGARFVPSQFRVAAYARALEAEDAWTTEERVAMLRAFFANLAEDVASDGGACGATSGGRTSPPAAVSNNARVPGSALPRQAGTGTNVSGDRGGDALASVGDAAGGAAGDA